MSKGHRSIWIDAPFCVPKMLQLVTTKPGKKYRSLKRPRVYEALRKRGYSKQSAARISNAQAHKTYTLAQLEAFVSSPHYDPTTAAAIAANVSALPSLKGEQVAPGVTRIHGNLCNVHGRYGPCDAALGAGAAAIKPPKPRKGRKPRKPAKTEAQRAAEQAKKRQERGLARATEHATNRQKILERMNIAPDGQSALGDLADGEQPRDPSAIARGGFEQAGLVERAQDGSYRMTASGRALMTAAASGDAGRAGDIISAARDRATARSERVQASQTRHEQAQARREQAAQARAKRLARRGKKMTTKAAGSPGDYLIVEDPAKSTTWHLQVKRNGKPDHGLMGSAWAALHSGFRGNVYQGPQKGAALAKLKKLYASENMPLPTTKAHDGPDILQWETWRRDPATLNWQAPWPNALHEGLRDHLKAVSFCSPLFSHLKVIKDARGNYRWVAHSSTAYRDRDGEIVSIKALTDDCAIADSSGQYGPLRWWHTPGLDLGDCDFNAMLGRVLFETGTFRSPSIAQKVAAAADELEISIGFLHLPTEPTPDGVFHHIRRFERSLVPRGKASNRFTALRVEELPMFDPTKVAALKQLGFSDDDITNFQTQAEATEKAADAQQVAYKADEAETEYPDVVLNGITYKAFPPKVAAAPIEGSPEEETAESPEEEAAEPDAGMDDTGGGLTLSPEDISAIGQAVSDALTTALGPLVSTMDLTNKIGNHMNDLKTMMGGYTAKKDASDAERAEQIASLQTALKDTQGKLDELLGLQPAVAPRASEAPSSIVNPFNPADNKLLQAIKDQVPADQLPQYSNEFEDLKLKLFGP